MRSKFPCDSCSLRRVRCDRHDPCTPCLTRSQDCTYLRTRKKPGPKGPRQLTTNWIREKQMEYRGGGVTPSPELMESVCGGGREGVRIRIPLSAYLPQLDLFGRRLHMTWPIVSVDKLKSLLIQQTTDADCLALASAVCAATMAQLRMAPESGIATAEDFARECLRYQAESSGRHEATVSAILTSLFLHMFYANKDQIVAATLSLREAIAYAHLMNLGDVDDLYAREPQECQLCLRVYLILFVTERTFCIEHNLPLTLQKNVSV